MPLGIITTNKWITQWGFVGHAHRIIISSSHGLVPNRRQIITQTNAVLSLVVPFEHTSVKFKLRYTNFLSLNSVLITRRQTVGHFVLGPVSITIPFLEFQIWWEFCLAIIVLLAIRLQHTSANATAAQVSCHIQNCLAIAVSESKWEWNDISNEFKIRCNMR